MVHACGVDFGTSNSTVGWVRPGQAALLALEDGKPTLPSVVFFNAEDETTYYGRAALGGYLAGCEGRLMRSLKSLLGTSLIEGQTEVEGRALPFRGLLSSFIGELKRRAEQAAGAGFSAAVLGRPVFFVDGDAAADREAEETLAAIARAAGFRQLEFQYEPIAAAFDYEARIGGEELVLVADIGGGTSDFSLLRLGPARAGRADRREDILATTGIHIGGTDFDRALSLACVLPLLGLGGRMKNGSELPSGPYFSLATWHTINQLYTQKSWSQLQDVYRDVLERDKFALLLKLVRERAGHWLAHRVEQAKIGLSEADRNRLALERLEAGLGLDLERGAFEAAIAGLAQGVERTVSAMLRQAGVRADAVDTVVFTGGSSGVPLLRQRIAAAVPGARQVEGDLFGSIGAGLALDAARKFG